MSKHRVFAEASERDGSVFRKVARVHCRKCGVSTSMTISNGATKLPPPVIAKKIEQKGWTIGDNENWDFCPAHNPKNKEKPALKLIREAVEQSVEPAAVPRVMTREDRRIIFEKLNEVYLNEAVGYEIGWSDHRVSTDLGVPRKWVETIRDENFGAIGVNPEMAEFLGQAENLLAESRSILSKCRQVREEIDKLVKDPQFASMGHISDRLGAVERLADKVRKLVV